MIGSACLRFIEYVGREMMRQMELADHDFDVDAEIILIAENLDHPAARILGRGGPVGDLDINHDIFQIVPVGAPCGFVAEHTMNGSSVRLPCGFSWFVVGIAVAFGSFSGISIPGGMMISWEIF